MSNTALSWVFHHSPYKGTAFCLHIAFADSANDEREFELFARQGWYARKARTTRQTVNRVIDQMVEDGALLLLQDNSRVGRPNTYRLVLDGGIPDVIPRGGVSSLVTGGVTTDDRGCNERRQGVSPETTHNPSRTPTLIPTDQPPELSPKGDVGVVFTAWLESTGKSDQTKLDAKRQRIIRQALKDFPLEDVVDAVKGWRHSPHHAGQNDRSTVYNGLHVLLRDAEQIEKFRDLERHQEAKPLKLNQNMERLQRLANGELTR